MQKVRRWVLGLLVIAGGASAGLGQPVPVFATTPEGAALFEAVVAVFADELRSTEGTGPYLGAAAELRAMLYAGVATLGLKAVQEDEYDDVCAYLVGAGGNPRLDGGGDLLGQRRPSEFPDSVVVAIGQPPGPSAAWWPEPGRRIVILDAFDLTALATSVRGLIDAYGPIALDPGDGDRAGLWSALYGYRVALAGPDVDPSTVPVPHGHLVAFHALANLGPNGRITQIVLDRPAAHGFERAILTIDVDGEPTSVREIHLVAVDFEDLAGIGDVLDDYRSNRADSIVTSWGFVDCALADRYAESAEAGSPPARTIAEFWEAAFAASGESSRLLAALCVAFEDAIAEALGTQPTCDTPDGLVGLATIVLVADVSARSAAAISWDPGSAARYFASAGNQGLAIPMPPAAWPGVYGVEACGAPNHVRERAWFSNAGAAGPQGFVRALGAWFVPPVAYRGSGGGPPVLGYWGTSYAAPTAAVIASSLSTLSDPYFFEPCGSP